MMMHRKHSAHSLVFSTHELIMVMVVVGLRLAMGCSLHLWLAKLLSRWVLGSSREPFFQPPYENASPTPGPQHHSGWSISLLWKCTSWGSFSTGPQTIIGGFLGGWGRGVLMEEGGWGKPQLPVITWPPTSLPHGLSLPHRTKPPLTVSFFSSFTTVVRGRPGRRHY